MSSKYGLPDHINYTPVGGSRVRPYQAYAGAGRGGDPRGTRRATLEEAKHDRAVFLDTGVFPDTQAERKIVQGAETRRRERVTEVVEGGQRTKTVTVYDRRNAALKQQLIERDGDICVLDGVEVFAGVAVYNCSPPPSLPPNHVQTELAHIIPVAHGERETTEDDVLLLCSGHHKQFDAYRNA
jgi:hypothetical protein